MDSRAMLRRTILALVACSLGCTGNDTTITGTINGRSFVSHDAFFGRQTHFDPGVNGVVVFTALYSFDYSGACEPYDGTESVPTISYQVGASLFTGSYLATPDATIDDMVKMPGEFRLSAPPPDASAGWVLQTSNTVLENSFSSGAITFTAVTDDELDGELDMSSDEGDHVTGTFSAPNCKYYDI